MVEKYSIRTDLALEQKERFESDNVEVQGVILEEEYDEEREIRVTTVKIETEKGAKTMGKPVGTYITMEAPNMAVPDEEYHREVSKELAEFIKGMVPEKKESYQVLVVGLGNRQVTPDALGPYVVDNLNITRHIFKEYGRYAMGDDEMEIVSAIVPGVMGQTGMETVEIIRGVVAETKPDFVVAIDALAARNSRRLNRTVQIADTGINPGSGVGNHRNGITKDTVGIPVIAIGVPTVVDAATIVNDTMENLLQALESSEALKGVGLVMQGYSAAEKYELVKELISPHLNGMFVTPKDIDDTVKRISYTISEALNILFSGTATA
ncbi:GPR endopeptidase [Bariatricus massiliensis]|uniref:Germination protease n=1 Tax=Bariatricus massiliensis TaxID=1745713 RepID=A0ABS8DDB1_9FIRM|nr:GPR endopeptidase [Bariatricus massiliensis]MCB7303563.1 GPR endopeptidase [Bariatricus massiliensis]MCB7373695.1 GPR endopeptidase [Bariatricus massiliensis]MCB7386365.1 GPR endopeptidase [Bariatricus massiliensis]MCB7410527.1 GPR endopeptidase [Bariatricus massiliensis]MCQ5252189.1 GPR endopeptidase [Bariatricus massiliensis]